MLLQQQFFNDLDEQDFETDDFESIEVSAKKCIDNFFSDKRMHCGGKIPKTILHNVKRIEMVINFSITNGVRYIYKLLKPTISEKEIAEATRTGDCTSDVRLVNDSLRFLAKSGVPQEFAGGMLVFYLDVCHGIKYR